MWAAGPAAGAALSRRELLERSSDSAAARHFLLGRDNPTDPFVPGQRCQAFPDGLCRLDCAEGFAQVRRHLVHGTAFLLGLHHTETLTRAIRCGNGEWARRA